MELVSSIATLKTEDDALIYLILDVSPDGYAKALEGKLPDVINLRVASRMHTARTKYQWMNRL
jgi:hypothetical protein